MKKILLLTFALLSLSVSVFAQNGLVTGQVTDMQNFSLPGAVLHLTPGHYHTISDNYGRFEFLNVPEGNYQMAITYMGYQQETIDLNVANNKVNNFQVRMK